VLGLRKGFSQLMQPFTTPLMSSAISPEQGRTEPFVLRRWKRGELRSRSPIIMRDASLPHTFFNNVTVPWWTFKFGAHRRRDLWVAELDQRARRSPGRACRLSGRRGVWELGGEVIADGSEWEYAARGGLDGAEFAWGDHSVLAPVLRLGEAKRTPTLARDRRSNRRHLRCQSKSG
jgi:hypothetical protein